MGHGKKNAKGNENKMRIDTENTNGAIDGNTENKDISD
jgi:hypothetical protein